MEASTAEWDPLAPSNSMIWKKSAKFKASSADGCADIDGKSLSKNTSNHLTQRACARGTGKLTGSIRLQEVYFQRRNLIFGFWFDFVDNSLVFRMLEDEEENVQQLEILVARFYRPFKMAASSKKYEKTIYIFYVWFKISFWHLFFFLCLNSLSGMCTLPWRPPCSHEDISSIFLNSETILFLHQIFYKGLQARMNNWPTLVLGNGP